MNDVIIGGKRLSDIKMSFIDTTSMLTTDAKGSFWKSSLKGSVIKEPEEIYPKLKVLVWLIGIEDTN